jgi:hypothetical protein
MVLLYMVTFTMNIPPMLAYIPAPWIQTGYIFVVGSYSIYSKDSRDRPIGWVQMGFDPTPSFTHQPLLWSPTARHISAMTFQRPIAYWNGPSHLVSTLDR